MVLLNEFSRTQLLYGKDAMTRLAQSRIAVFGIGGVGGYVVEALAKVMRRECRKRGIDSLKVVYSKEPPIRPLEDIEIKK